AVALSRLRARHPRSLPARCSAADQRARSRARGPTHRRGLRAGGVAAMVDHADVIVIGSGALGSATAFYLAKRGARNVILVEKHDIASQTSPRAAGMVSCMRRTDLMTQLIRRAVEGIQHFTEETGQPLDWVHSGSLKVARRPQDAAVIERDLDR